MIVKKKNYDTKTIPAALFLLETFFIDVQKVFWVMVNKAAQILNHNWLHFAATVTHYTNGS